MKKNLKYFIVIGFGIGLIEGIRHIFIAYYKAPSFPGIHEILLQFGFCGILGLTNALYGFILWAICISISKLYSKL